MTIHWKAVEQYFTVLLVFESVNFENLSLLDVALSGVKKRVSQDAQSIMCNW